MYKHLRSAVLTANILAACALAAPAVHAQTSSDEQLKAAIAKLDELSRRIEALEKEKAEKQAQAAVDRVPAAKPNPNAVEVKLKPAPSLQTADGKTSFAIDGRVLVDAGVVLADGKADIGDDTDIRHLWLGVGGKFDGDWRYKLQVGLDNNAVSVKDAYIAYDGIKNVPIMIGNFYENNGVEIMSGNLSTTFMEPASGIGAFRVQRYLGVTADPYGDNWGAQIGFFGDGVADAPAGTDDEGWSFASRFTGALINTKTQLLHVGGAYRYRAPNSPADTVRFSSAGESHVIGETLVDTGNITGVTHYDTYALEAMYRFKSLTLMSEYNVTDVKRILGASPEFGGGYVSLGWFITGEQREYNAKRGLVGRLKPNAPFSMNGDGIGAWEVAGRVDRLDLSNGPTSGGEMDSYTLGLNWYPNTWARLMLNYVYNNLDSTGPAAYRNTDPRYLMLRVQADF